MINLFRIRQALRPMYRLNPGVSDKISTPHRYKGSETVQNKAGREFYIILPIFYTFRWHPLDPWYLVQDTATGEVFTVADYNIW